ncbi:PREDICTED: poly(A)-specific ribonuclease PARN-like [Nicrophorus vespilloides]|uniref:Poly(A)-specific ribonuclease PARN-like n=1 Tax=Nicrophorus vespilloides TaxID=110193 RepID=A0ABM1M1Z0_NICVS|nr:PREDICTED: poly(A)-specific ribonuclease PARN-like [Nicrophorus vespilloides]
MEITKSTYFEKLPEVKAAIDASTFIAIDCELTGINTTSEINAYDTPKQYFEKVHKNSKDFLVIQFGICTFTYCEKSKSFQQQAFNFYIFPRPLNRMVPDCRFLCQSSSIDFLVKQGFDFNKLFNEGIPYLNTQHEAKYREVLEEGRQARAKLYLSPQTLNRISIPEEDQPFIDKVFAEIEKFIASDKDEHILPKCNPFIRRLIYQTARERIDKRASLETRQLENKDRVLVVTRPKSIDDRNKDEENKKLEEAEVLKQAIGFSEIIKYLAQSRKLIVGHNMLLDVCHTIDKFLSNLPEKYESFKECVNCLFPFILDTKYMSSSGPFKDLITSTVLSHLLTTVTNSPFGLPKIDSEAENGYSLDSSKEHEAGYDAYITGLSFIAMWKYLGKGSDSTFKDFKLLKPYINRLFLMRIQDAPYMQLDGADPNPSRDHVFYLLFPKEWKLNDITELFSPFGNVYVAWLDDRSAYIALHKREQAAVALSTLSQSDRYSIMTYVRRQAILAGISSIQTSPLARRRKSSEGLPPRKRRKSNNDSNVFKRGSIEPVMEVEMSEEAEADSTKPCLIKPRKRTISKTFEEDNSWE